MEQPLEASHINQKTVLVVDDEPQVLQLVSALMIDSNYHVIGADNGPEALLISQHYKGDIHLLLSDFQMPGMSGVELATKLVLERTDLKVLLMSSFPEGMLILNEGWHFLAKPFLNSQLKALVTGLVSPERSSKFQS